jgi:hypothetical protein
MSFRRKSCETCFKARRKCNLAQPICSRCERNHKSCHYMHPTHALKSNNAFNTAGTTTIQTVAEAVSADWMSYPKQFDTYALQSLDRKLTVRPRPEVPEIPGPLGQLEPVRGNSASFAWVFNQFREYPLAFATTAETVFINKALYQDAFPRPLRAAFGICAACITMTERNRSVLFQALDDEISELLTPSLTNTILEDLVKLQAAVLYQTIRIYHGGIEHRITAERQEYIVRAYGLKLLQRAKSELQDVKETWETWLLMESIRRTVHIAFKLYTIYAAFKYGACSETNAIASLPISSKSGAWVSRDIYQQYPERDETIPYSDFKLIWDAFPRREREPWEKLLFVGCEGIDRFETMVAYHSVKEIDV